MGNVKGRLDPMEHLQLPNGFVAERLDALVEQTLALVQDVKSPPAPVQAVEPPLIAIEESLKANARRPMRGWLR